MVVPIYFVFYIIAVFLHFLDYDYCSIVLKFAMLIPVIEFLVLTLQERKLTLFNIARSSSFILISIVNYYAFSYEDLTYIKLIYAWIVIGFIISIFLKWKLRNYYAVRLTIYALLAILTITNSSMSHIKRMYFYTLGNPFYSAEMEVGRLHEFAYLYYVQGDLSNTFFLLNRCKDKIRENLKNPLLTQKERQILLDEYVQVENSTVLVMQGKWRRNEKIFE